MQWSKRWEMEWHNSPQLEDRSHRVPTAVEPNSTIREMLVQGVTPLQPVHSFTWQAIQSYSIIYSTEWEYENGGWFFLLLPSWLSVILCTLDQHSVQRGHSMQVSLVVITVINWCTVTLLKRRNAWRGLDSDVSIWVTFGCLLNILFFFNSKYNQISENNLLSALYKYYMTHMHVFYLHSLHMCAW